jgi:hypothetical protein
LSYSTSSLAKRRVRIFAFEVLGVLDKINFITDDVFSGADPQQLAAYAKWSEYIKTV